MSAGRCRNAFGPAGGTFDIIVLMTTPALHMAGPRTPRPPVGLLDMDLGELETWLTAAGEPRYRARQVWRALYRDFTPDPALITTLPKPLRERLASDLPLPTLVPLREWLADNGATTKVLFQLHDGKAIESVLMEYEDGRATVCVSSQAGCAMGCVFCATGLGGFDRNLSTGEIIGQILYFCRLLAHRGKKLTNIVYMGMGEPLANPGAVWKSIHSLHSPEGMRFSPRRITVSTVGLVPQIRRFAEERLPVNLAVSLHAPDDELRSRLMPVNRRWPIAELLEAVRGYTELTGRRVSFEYALIAGQNSSPEHARALAERVSGLLCHVNLIPLNNVPGSPLMPPSPDEVRSFQSILRDAGVPCTVRLERGADILAACGQLRIEHARSA
ncbi:MAG: 23S rRNA (adenine(2503)-C(2))-methyltransferase RlmN [Chloroflexota bacterium]|nr:23S rRNA (adenine(2503)-C(2))-methyltransferase RlmN [Chloroflexota bacterium]